MCKKHLNFKPAVYAMVLSESNSRMKRQAYTSPSSALYTYDIIVQYRPGATGGHTGAVPPQLSACAPPNENCAPPQARTVPRRN